MPTLADLANLFVFVVLVKLLVTFIKESRKTDRVLFVREGVFRRPFIPMSIDYQKSGGRRIKMRLRLREIREKAGMSQSDLAKASGVSQSHISHRPHG